MTALDFRPGPSCAIDSIPIPAHTRCRACHILVGAGHYDPAVHHGLCGSCKMRPSLHEVRIAYEPTPDMVALWKREDMALALSDKGYSIMYIALEVKTSRRNAYTMIDRAKRRRRG